MDLSYVDRLAFASAMIEVIALLVRIFLAASLVVSVLASFVGCAVCTLNGLVVLLYSRGVTCKEEARLDTSLYKNTQF